MNADFVVSYPPVTIEPVTRFQMINADLETASEGRCGVSRSRGEVSVLTGGYGSLKMVESFDLTTDEHTYNPDLNHKRWAHSCSQLDMGLGILSHMVTGNAGKGVLKYCSRKAD